LDTANASAAETPIWAEEKRPPFAKYSASDCSSAQDGDRHAKFYAPAFSQNQKLYQSRATGIRAPSSRLCRSAGHSRDAFWSRHFLHETQICGRFAMSATFETQSYASLSDIPRIDIPQNLNLALSTKRHVLSILREILNLWRGPGKLTPQEYFYYRLWDPALPLEEKRRFVGKRAQNAMHLTCNSQYWYCAAADKILFHTIMSGASLPVPDLVAISAEGRTISGIPNLTNAAAFAALLRRPEIYPLFMKEVGGKYSLSVVSADSYDQATDEVVLLDGTRLSPESLAEKLITPRGYLVQRRLRQAPALAALFGARLWSVRVFVTLGKAGPRIHRATAKIATGTNPADNYWRQGNMLGVIDLESGKILRSVCGSGAELRVNDPHPDTGRPIIGAEIPDWNQVKEIVVAAGPLFAGIRSQSWDVALTEDGPVLLEVNFGGDLNLTQLATGKGVLDADYSEHLNECGYRTTC
jgi:hypothetical protein